MTLELTVPNLACSACVDAVTEAIQAIDATAQVNADTKTKQVSIIMTATDEAVKAAVTSAQATP